MLTDITMAKIILNSSEFWSFIWEIIV